MPPIAKHEKPKPAPPAPSATEFGCGSVRVGDEDIALECVDPAPAAGAAEEPRVVVSYSLMPVPAEALPKFVDHREDGMEAPPRNQGHVGSCTAFATTSALDHDFALWTGKVDPISVMQMWGIYHDGGVTLRKGAIIGKTFARDSEWPYDDKVAHSWTNPKGSYCAKDPSACGKTPDAAKLAELEKKGILAVTQIERIWLRKPSETPKDHLTYPRATDLPIEEMRAAIAAGHDLVIAMHLPPPFTPVASKDDSSGAMYVPDIPDGYKAPDNKPRGHMMSLTGYQLTNDGTYFLLKNSWDPKKWGEGDYAWIHDSTLEKMIGEVWVADAEPVSTEGLRRPLGAKGHVDACTEGVVPDSVTARCTNRCADGSPTANGVCGDSEGCEAGEVNLTGECVLAAPKLHGTDPKSGVAFECGPGGCVYTLPAGFDGCKAHCQKSCPAPDFHLGRGTTLTCVQ